MMLAPVRYNYATVEMLTVDPIDLAAAIDAAVIAEKPNRIPVKMP
ncbi:MAG: hypothetical protein ACM3SP_02975 [Chloroflexota bacterium]